MIFNSTKLIVTGLAALAVGGIIYAGYVHYTNIVEDVKKLEKANTQLEIQIKTQESAIEQQRATIDNWAEAEKKLKQQLEDLQELERESRKEATRLNDILTDHNLDRLAKAKPGLIEKRINRGTVGSFRMHECATGNTDSCSAVKK